MSAPLLSIEQLRVGFETGQGPLTVVDGVSLEVHRGEILALVGESGCGKSVTALSILRLAGTNSVIQGGAIHFDGVDLARLAPQDLRRYRGNEIGYIFQEPMTSLNPVLTIGEQIMESLILHRKLSRKQAQREAVDLLAMVNMPSPATRIQEYPHQLSGGMRQRVMIAIALSCRPKLLIADEPTTALDVTVQAQILQLLESLQEELGMAIILITHDMGVVAEFAHRVAVMYAGKVAEVAAVEELFARPGHPYTRALMRSIPPMDKYIHRLPTLAGTVPLATEMPPGCRFFGRCEFAEPACQAMVPPLITIGPQHQAACIRTEVVLAAPIEETV